MQDKIIAVISDIAGMDDIDVTTTLAELDLDSLEITEIAMGIEEEIGANIPETMWTKFKTVQDVIDYARSKS